MNEKKTTLQKIVEQKSEQIRIAIEQAIDDGAKIEKRVSATCLRDCCNIDEVFLQKNTVDDTISVVLTFRSKKIEKVFEQSKEDLEKLAAQKRAELEEIEKQINAKQ